MGVEEMKGRLRKRIGDWRMFDIIRFPGRFNPDVLRRFTNRVYAEGPINEWTFNEWTSNDRTHR